jgi:uncharacterized protein YdiU (UPF0061 family)
MTLGFQFDNSYARDLDGFYAPMRPDQVPDPKLVLLNRPLAEALGLDVEKLRGPDGLAAFSGNTPPRGATPLAQAYAGHQFGGFSPQLGDGRAILLGEITDRDGARFDIQLKGSGRTPFSRGGDGKAALGPVLREYIMGEAMHALGIPTTRALAAVTTGEDVTRETRLPGAILTRVAASHIRVGTFQFFAARDQRDMVKQLADYAIARHYPELTRGEDIYLNFLRAVADKQAALIAKWMNVGFIHGVMNTDNMAISGETIDYGPCAFMDGYNPATVFSSIDHHGRYAYANQPNIAQWNLARFAETLLPLIDADGDTSVEKASEIINGFPQTYTEHWLAGMRAKLGIVHTDEGDLDLVNALFEQLGARDVDFTTVFRALTAHLSDGQTMPRVFTSDPAMSDWFDKWTVRIGSDTTSARDVMQRANPIYIPRNHLVEEALSAAHAGDIALTEKLISVLSDPFTSRDGLERYAEPAPEDFGPYQTFCGT